MDPGRCFLIAFEKEYQNDDTFIIDCQIHLLRYHLHLFLEKIFRSSNIRDVFGNLQIESAEVKFEFPMKMERVFVKNATEFHFPLNEYLFEY